MNDPKAPGYDSLNMATVPIPVDLPEEARNVALGSRIERVSLRQESRAAIERSPPHVFGIPYRTVTCTAAEAQDLFQYFQNTANILITLDEAKAAACAVAADNLRLALRLAGVLHADEHRPQ
jgi:hypothetical protein